ncbi:MAG: sugar phosphate isomerase/epimerase [Verrucomicrobia bacterium]|nr:sugar phosphate isomerase/epimerase [Verrucomicrobiota bacterium]MDA1086978.1 sugar phosphate isomerase/epimerase [Verrucomicrobiota bacterium]
MNATSTKNVIACRPGCIDLPLADALKALKGIGVGSAELDAPHDDDYASLLEVAQSTHINISTLSVAASAVDTEGVNAIRSAIRGASQIGTPIIFLAARAPEGGYDAGIKSLQDLGARATDAGVVLSLETHEPFAHNGDIARRTIEAVNSPGVRWNYDSANIYYYNEPGIDTVAELRKTLPLVASVHLKDSAKGEPRSFDFPVFGEGVVDFPEVFRVLAEHGFHGPHTMELEGPLVDGLSPDEQIAKVKACVDYLASIDAI